MVTTLEDGRKVILHQDGTWEFVIEEDIFKLLDITGEITTINLGEGIKIGELLIIFDSIEIVKFYNTGIVPILTPGEPLIWRANDNYKFVVVKVKGENIGKRKDGLWRWGTEKQNYEIEVDKGYFYDPLLGENIININLLPEETDSDELVFEILESTLPLKLHASIKGQEFIVNLK